MLSAAVTSSFVGGPSCHNKTKKVNSRSQWEFMPSAARPLTDSPCNLKKSDKHEIVAEAKRLIDPHLRP